VKQELKKKQDWQHWFTVAQVKGADCMKVKAKGYSNKSWPGSEHLGNCLCAMVVRFRRPLISGRATAVSRTTLQQQAYRREPNIGDHPICS